MKNVRRKQTVLEKILPRPFWFLGMVLCTPKDLLSVLRFLLKKHPQLSLSQRWKIAKKLYIISYKVDCTHSQREMLTFINTILSLPKSIRGCVVEAGCYKGGSSAKFSLATELADRPFVIFDSFEGMPEHDEPHQRSIFGAKVAFPKGRFCGGLEEVKENIERYGKSKNCSFKKGWFEESLPSFKDPIAAIYLDVDLASSTKTCLKYLYPLLEPGGVLYSQDGHLPLVIDVFRDKTFWEKEVGYPPPKVEGLGKKKLIKIVKPA